MPCSQRSISFLHFLSLLSPSSTSSNKKAPGICLVYDLQDSLSHCFSNGDVHINAGLGRALPPTSTQEMLIWEPGLFGITRI